MNNDKRCFKSDVGFNPFRMWILRHLGAKRITAWVINRAHETGKLDSFRFHELHAINEHIWERSLGVNLEEGK